MDEADALRAIEDAVCRNLRALGLHVRAERFGRGFCEIAASTSPRFVTTPDGEDASGVMLLLARAFDPPLVVFEEINSLRRGLGRAMVAAALDGVSAQPGVFRHIRVNDLSPFQPDGRRWWATIADLHRGYDWIITHELDATHVSAPPDAEELAQSSDFARKRSTLAALALEFGFDATKVSLRSQPEPCAHLGQSFIAEAEAFPDGRIEIYYDPSMSDARLGCCLAHEIQHVKYFALREAFRGEPDDGPLHRRFAAFTPELLAAQRGVSDYSSEHWKAWRGGALPQLFSDELGEGGAEPINETIAEVAKAFYNWGCDVRINAIWRDLKLAIDEEYERLRI